MKQKIGIGIQDFEKIRTRNIFYVDKTDFIREWWESNDDVTLITRPRRFGKTLTLSMTEQFFSLEYAGRFDLFEGLSIWEREEYRKLQGTYPVISLSFARIKEDNFRDARLTMGQLLTEVFNKYTFLSEWEGLNVKEKEFIAKIDPEMDSYVAVQSLNQLSSFLSRYYGKKVIILLDEYDTPMQEAYVNGYWKELVSFMRNFFNAAFKINPYVERALMTGITRVSRESMFSDMNNLNVVTTTSEEYATAFGFTEEEVFTAMDDFGLSKQKEKVKFWYDGFIFGNHSDIYNPWSMINYLDKKLFETYWANTSSNNLAGKLIREGSKDIKIIMEGLLNGEFFCTAIDEQIVFDQLDKNESAIWSLLLASGYLKAERQSMDADRVKDEYKLSLTNYEVRFMFRNLIEGWFKQYSPSYNDFIKALLSGDVEAMNYYMNKVALATFSSFDVGNKPSEAVEPERFYHGFVLGLMVELNDRYVITSNRESGFGRYDVMLEPKGESDHAYVLEFKVHNPGKEKSLSDTVKSALDQIEKKQYEAALINKGILAGRIRKYGFAFEGKNVLIG
ncbi:MAG: ATP-binding protein [Roseburia sp.]|nr:ATP-binding protein [Roseburia sp.]